LTSQEREAIKEIEKQHIFDFDFDEEGEEEMEHISPNTTLNVSPTKSQPVVLIEKEPEVLL
jgi:hypothetical protein